MHSLYVDHNNMKYFILSMTKYEMPPNHLSFNIHLI